MDQTLAKQWIGRWEGVRTTVYTDTVGKPTIGIGLNLATEAARDAIAALGLDYQSVLTGNTSLTTDQVEALFEGSLTLALTAARNLLPNFDQIPENQQLAVVDLAFNLGQTSLSLFHDTLAAIQNQDWPSAAENLQNSRWFHQVGSGPTQRGGADVAVLGNTATPQAILGMASTIGA